MKELPNTVQELLNIPIQWKKIPQQPKWLSIVGNSECCLTLNSFPDEALYTLTWRNQTYDLDDLPKFWAIPRI